MSTTSSRSGSRPPSRGPPHALPKAPTSAEVARRMLANAEARPVKRFDSADYFMNQYLATQQRATAPTDKDATPSGYSSEGTVTPPSTARDVLLLPPPLENARKSGEGMRR